MVGIRQRTQRPYSPVPVCLIFPAAAFIAATGTKTPAIGIPFQDCPGVNSHP